MDINNSCCCCLLRPPDKYLQMPYTCLDRGKTEIYANMIKECFEIQLIIQISHKEYGICEECVGRLREASDFKLQVQRSQAELRARLQGATHVKEEDPEKPEISDDDFGPDCREELIRVAEEIKTEVADDSLPRYEGEEFKEFMIDEENECPEVYAQGPLCPITDIPRKEDYEHSAGGPLAKRYGDNIRETLDLDTPRDSKAQGHHKSGDHKKKPYTCDICAKQFHSHGGFGIHMSRMHKIKEHICAICKKRFRRKSLFDEHKRSHKGETPFRCKICNMRYASKTGLLHHKSLHTTKVFICDICKSQFKHRHVLIYHMQSHTGQTVCQCTICHEKFLDRAGLNKHIRTEHAYNEYYICDECKKVFTTKRGLIMHLNVHTKREIYQCNICAKTLASKPSLQRHKATHTALRAYGCEICKSRFRLKQALKKHRTTHAGEKKHCCDICGKQFARSDYLTRHVKIHAEGTSFPCELCPKSYSTKECLRQHKRIHTKKAVANSVKKRQKKKKLRESPLRRNSGASESQVEHESDDFT